MAFFLSPIGNTQTIDANGDPLVGGTIETYLAGTSTARTTYTSNTGATPQGVVMTLNSIGYPTNGPVWMIGGVPLKFIIKNALGVVQSTFDNVSGIGDNSVTPDQFPFIAPTPTYISATSFSFVGDQTNDAQKGRRIRSINTGGTIYSTIVNAVFGAGITTVTVVNDSGVLDSGLSQVNYSLLTATSPSLPAIGAYGQCQLVKSGANLQLNPKNGNLLTINGIAEKIPSTPPTLTPAGLPATTLEYIYAWMNGAAMTLEASTTGHSTDATTGMEIKTGDATRTLVGMAYVKTAATFADNASQRFTRSWFNDPGAFTSVVLGANTAQSNTSYAEPASTIRNEIALWATDVIVITLSGSVSSNGLGNTVTTGIGVDVTNASEFGGSRCYQPAANIGMPMACSIVKTGLSEGYHFITMVGLTDAGTATWSGSPSAVGCNLSVYTKK